MASLRNFSKSLLIVFLMVIFQATVQAQFTQQTLYGALYEAENLVAAGEEPNTESVVLFYPEEEGFIAVTNNMTASEWWTSSDELGLIWERSTSNPLEPYHCTQVGRHSVVMFEGEMYFGANCTGNEATAWARSFFKLTSKNTVELIHSTPVQTGEEDQPNQYPTAAVVKGKLYMFYNGGVTVYDGATAQDVENLTGQPEGTPLEASGEMDGKIYLSFNSGEVMQFDGESYTLIGEDYLEEAEPGSTNNLPSIEVWTGDVYVGNQDLENGASLFQYDPDDTNGDGSEWEVVVDLEPADEIINKMHPLEVDGVDYLILYTSNKKTGTNVYALDATHNLMPLLPAGLGENDPENTEVVSITDRLVNDNDVEKRVMVFGTKNMEEQTKLFILNADEDLAVSAEVALSESQTTQKQLSRRNAKATHTKGKTFQVTIPQDQVQEGDLFVLKVNGKIVDRETADESKVVVLEYKKAKNMKAGMQFTVQIGRKVAYGTGEDQVLSRNTIWGEKLKVRIRKK